jgi:hypothetical protein
MSGSKSTADMLTTLWYLTCKVKAPNQHDYKKQIWMLSYIMQTLNLPLRPSSGLVTSYKIGGGCTVCNTESMCSQTGGTVSLGKGSVNSASRTQKLNTTSSTEAEIVVADDIMPQINWTRCFLQCQGVNVSHNTLYQDNRRTI